MFALVMTTSPRSAPGTIMKDTLESEYSEYASPAS